MATVMNPQRSRHLATTRTATQKVCIGMGILFVIVGLVGIVMPGLLNMHLSLAHNFIHLASGALALWSGYSDYPRKAYNFCIGFGAVYGLLGVSGFIFGEPGYPGVGHMEADENLLRIIPNSLELGTADHSVHLLISAVFLITAFAFRRHHAEAGVTKDRFKDVSNFSIRNSSRSSELPNSESRLPDVDLGRSDINRSSDRQRRSDFERRL